MITLYPLLALLFSFTGIIFGLILSLIAPEEIVPGKRYLLFLKYILFFAIFVVGNYSFLLIGDYYFGLIFSIIIPVLFILTYVKLPFIEYGNYVVFSIMFLVEVNFELSLILASLVFLYGFPTGTLLRKIYIP